MLSAIQTQGVAPQSAHNAASWTRYQQSRWILHLWLATCVKCNKSVCSLDAIQRDSRHSLLLSQNFLTVLVSLIMVASYLLLRRCTIVVVVGKPLLIMLKAPSLRLALPRLLILHPGILNRFLCIAFIRYSTTDRPMLRPRAQYLLLERAQSWSMQSIDQYPWSQHTTIISTWHQPMQAA